MATDQTIDPLEAALCVIGVRPLVSKAIERVTMAQFHEMEALPREIRKLARAVVGGERMTIPLGSVNWKRTLTDLTEEYGEQQLIEMVEKFPAPLQEIAGEFVIIAKKVRELLLSLLPRGTKDTLGGPEPLPPPALAVRRFAVALEVLDDPRRVFALIATGSLLKSQVAVVREVYPTISAAIDAELEDAAVDARAAKKSFRLTPHVEIGAATWTGVPRVSPQMANRLAGNFKKANAEKDAAPKPAPGGESIVAKESLTQTQRSLYNQPSKAG